MGTDSMDWGRRIALMRRQRGAWWVSVHYSAERFAVLLVASVLVIAIAITLVLRDARVKRDDVFATTSVYLESSVSSISQQLMSVEHLYISPEKTKAFLLLKWSEDAVDNVALSAESYNVLLGARSPTMRVGSRPSAVWAGGVVTYGVTGYVGVLLMCQEKFPMEVLDIVLVIDETVHDDENKTAQQWGYDVSKKDHVVFRINPSVPGIDTLQSLSPDTPNFFDIYSETFLEPEEATIRRDAVQYLKKMQEDIRKIDEQEKRLKSVSYSGIKIIPPDRDSTIADDVIECSDKDEDECELATRHVIDGGWDFDWKKMALNDGGYVDMTCAGGAVGTNEYSECLDNKYNSSRDVTMDDGLWKYSDGQVVDFNSEGDDDSYGSALLVTARKVQEARVEYFDDKKSYQADVMYRLLSLSHKAAVMKDNYATHANAVTMMGE